MNIVVIDSNLKITKYKLSIEYLNADVAIPVYISSIIKDNLTSIEIYKELNYSDLGANIWLNSSLFQFKNFNKSNKVLTLSNTVDYKKPNLQICLSKPIVIEGIVNIENYSVFDNLYISDSYIDDDKINELLKEMEEFSDSLKITKEKINLPLIYKEIDKNLKKYYYDFSILKELIIFNIDKSNMVVLNVPFGGSLKNLYSFKDNMLIKTKNIKSIKNDMEIVNIPLSEIEPMEKSNESILDLNTYSIIDNEIVFAQEIWFDQLHKYDDYIKKMYGFNLISYEIK